MIEFGRSEYVTRLDVQDFVARISLVRGIVVVLNSWRIVVPPLTGLILPCCFIRDRSAVLFDMLSGKHLRPAANSGGDDLRNVR